MSTLCVTKLNKINDFLVLHVFSVFCPFVGRSYSVYFKSIYSFDRLFFCLFPNIFFILLNDFADIFSFNLFCMIESSCISQYFYSSILFSIQIFPLSGSSIPSFTTCLSNVKFIPIDLAICIYVYCEATPTVRDVLEFSDSHICPCLYSFLWFERERFLNCLDWLYRWRHICVIRIIPDEGES